MTAPENAAGATTSLKRSFANHIGKVWDGEFKRVHVP